MKTVKEWLEELPDGYRERALGQMLDADRVVYSMAHALTRSLSWISSNEGFDFWSDVRNHYLYGLPLPPLPEDPMPTHVVEMTITQETIPTKQHTLIQPGFPTNRTTAEMIAIMQQYKDEDEWECREWGREAWTRIMARVISI